MQAPLQNTIAIVYDFDGTLSPDNMQETTIFESYKIDKDEFWGKSNALVANHGYEKTLAYLKLLISDERFQRKPLTSQFLKSIGRNQIRYFEGVESYFGRIESFLSNLKESSQNSISIEHYIVSSGIKEILEGSSIAPHFKRMYACEFDYDSNGHPIYPKLVINDTNKTQFLFRINKGKLNIDQEINSHMPQEERPIPFRNMIYIGDGDTDIPSMVVTQKNGGHAIAVYNEALGVNQSIMDMVDDKRVDHFAPADYSENSLLMKILKITIHKIVMDINYRSSSRLSRSWVKGKKSSPSV